MPENKHVSQVTVQYHASEAGARQAAVDRRGTSIPGAKFMQGSRCMFVGAITLGELANLVREDHLPQGKTDLSDVEKSDNRPLIDDHVNKIKSYLLAVGNWILGGVILVFRSHQGVAIHTFHDVGPERAFAYVPTSVQAYFLDGQHRGHGIWKALDALKKLKEDVSPGAQSAYEEFALMGIPVHIVIEDDRAKCIKDFEALGRTRTISKGYIQTRSDAPFPALARELMKAADMEDQVDCSSATKPEEGKVATITWLTALVSGAVCGDHVNTSITEARQLALLNGIDQEALKEDLLLVLRDLVAAAKNLGDETKTKKSMASQKAVYGIMGEMVYAIRHHTKDRVLQKNFLQSLLTDLPWNREAPIWSPMIDQTDHSVMTNRNTRNATKDVLLARIQVPKPIPKRGRPEAGTAQP
jgi:DGQHR domain-containing protein